MASVMGFTWVFGLASSVLSAVTETPSRSLCYALHALGVLFPILNSSQGLFVFFAFVFNRRVLALYRQLFANARARFALHRNKLVLTPCANSSNLWGWKSGAKDRDKDKDKDKASWPKLSNIAVISRD
jgi:hypothetical protein